MTCRGRMAYRPAYRRISLFLSVFFFCFGTVHSLFHTFVGGECEAEQLSAASSRADLLSEVDDAHSPEVRAEHLCPVCSQPLTFFCESGPFSATVFVLREVDTGAIRAPVFLTDIRLPHTRGPPVLS